MSPATATATVPAHAAAHQPAVSSHDVEQVERALIDASARTPVLFFYTTAITWLIAATFFGFVASIKLSSPEFLGSWSWLTYGRVWPAYTNTLAYGWGFL